MKFFLYIFAVVLPPLAFFLMDLPGPALVAVMLQGTFIGWPIATIWALKHVMKRPSKKKRNKAA